MSHKPKKIICFNESLSLFCVHSLEIFFFNFLYSFFLHSKILLLSWFLPPHKSYKPSSLCLFPNQPPSTSLSWYTPTMLDKASLGQVPLLPSPGKSFIMLIVSRVFRASGLIDIHLSLTAFHLHSFVIGLPHLGCFFFFQFQPYA